MTKRLHTLLQAARQHEFIGRSPLLAAWQQWVQPTTPDHYLHFVHGGIGLGKTALLRQFQEYCQHQGIPALYLHAGEHDPTPASFLAHLQQRWGGQACDLPATWEHLDHPVVLLLDGFERLLPLDDWFRLEWLPQLPPNVLVVLASRLAPSAAWLTDLGWQPYLRVEALEPFTPAETAAFLTRRALPATDLAAIHALTGGNPLALTLVASSYAEAPWSGPFCLQQNPALLQRLFQHLVAPLATPPAYQLLELVALLRQVTESLLQAILPPAEASRSFEWLRQQPWMQRSPQGLAMAEPLRALILADLEWRNPEGLLELQRRLSGFLSQQMQQHPERVGWRYLQELAFLHRHQPQLRSWLTASLHWEDYSANVATPADLAAWAQVVERQEGPLASKDWLDRGTAPGASVMVWRNRQGQRVAFRYALLASPDTARPAPAGLPAPAALQVNPHEKVAWLGWWLPAVSDAEATALTGLLIWEGLLPVLQTAPALSLVHCPGWSAWVNQVPALATFPWEPQHCPGAASSWQGLDWRRQAPLSWLTQWLQQPEVTLAAPAAAATVVILGEKAFAQAAATALKHYHQRDLLLDNPLLRSRLVTRLLDPASSHDVLQRLHHWQFALSRALALLEDSPHDARYHRVLYRTFINPVGSREKTAEFLNLSFSTYRRYVKAGVERLCQLLWRMELDPALLQDAADQRLKQTA